ncbi:MAG: serine/threonine-protein kinase [Polyangiaceae bacterium]
MTDRAKPTPSGPEVDPLAGTAYRAIRRIGAGSMGQVFEAEHSALGRRVAVKLLNPVFAGDPGFVDRLRLEAHALARVRHPNVVVIHDHAVTPDGVPFLVTELLHGRNLHQLLRADGPLPLEKALDILDPIFAGLTAIHAAGLVHRDLKPANVFLSDDAGQRTVKLLDFGIVKVSPSATSGAVAPLRVPTQDGQVLGTPRFMAPEQVRGEACDARTDVYAAGVLLFLLVAGRDPFHHHGAELALLTAHALELPPLLSKTAAQPIPPGVDAAAARALAKKPEERFQSVTEFGAALRAALRPTSKAPPAFDLGHVLVTEKISASTWTARPPETAPIDASVFRAPVAVLPFGAVSTAKIAPGAVSRPASVMPFAPAPAPAPPPASSRPVRRLPPSFGLPPLSPAAVSSAPERLLESCGGAPVVAAPSPGEAASGSSSLRKAAGGPHHRILYAAVALLWCLVVVVAWRVL